VQTALAKADAPVHPIPHQTRRDKHFEELSLLATEQMKRLIEVDEKVSRLTSASVRTEDQLTLMNFFDSLLDFTSGASKAAASIDWTGVDPILIRHLENIKHATSLLATAARKAKEGGCSVKAIRSAMPEMRRVAASMDRL
jgi:hypothetical protein